MRGGFSLGPRRWRLATEVCPGWREPPVCRGRLCPRGSARCKQSSPLRRRDGSGEKEQDDRVCPKLSNAGVRPAPHRGRGGWLPPQPPRTPFIGRLSLLKGRGSGPVGAGLCQFRADTVFDDRQRERLILMRTRRHPAPNERAGASAAGSAWMGHHRRERMLGS